MSYRYATTPGADLLGASTSMRMGMAKPLSLSENRPKGAKGDPQLKSGIGSLPSLNPASVEEHKRNRDFEKYRACLAGQIGIGLARRFEMDGHTRMQNFGLRRPERYGAADRYLRGAPIFLQHLVRIDLLVPATGAMNVTTAKQLRTKEKANGHVHD